MTTVSHVTERARALRAQGRLLDALEALTRAEEFHADVCAERGAIEFALGRYSDAALSLSAVAVTRPDDPRAHFNLGLCLERAQRWDAAAGTFERVLYLDPARTETRLALGSCLLKMNRPQEALTHFEQTRGHHPQALFGKAVALQLLGRLREAGSAYEEALTLEPDSEEVLANWIALSIDAGDLERAGALSARLRTLSPCSKVALQGLAAAALEQGDFDAAMTNCGCLLDLAPECLEAWHNLRIAMEQAQFRPTGPVFTGPALTGPAFAEHHGGTL